MRLLLPAVVFFVLAAPAHAAARPCRSADLREGAYGLSHLRVYGGTCTTARGVAKEWVRRLGIPGRSDVPRRVRGFVFEDRLITNSPNSYMRGVKGKTTIHFDYYRPGCS